MPRISTPLKDDILYLLSHAYYHGIPFPKQGLQNIIYKHSKDRYSNPSSPRVCLSRITSDLENQGIIEEASFDLLGLEITGWKLTNKGVSIVKGENKNLNYNPRANSESLMFGSLISDSGSPTPLYTTNDRREGYD